MVWHGVFIARNKGDYLSPRYSKPERTSQLQRETASILGRRKTRNSASRREAF
jgi:hypothetical protein